MSGDAALNGMIASLRQVRGMVEQATPEVAATLREELGKQITSGQDPSGQAWQKTRDNEQPLQNAEQALAVTHHGTVVFARIKGPEARHNNGTARGRIVRRILPKSGFATGVADKIKAVLTREYKLAVKP